MSAPSIQRHTAGSLTTLFSATLWVMPPPCLPFGPSQLALPPSLSHRHVQLPASWPWRPQPGGGLQPRCRARAAQHPHHAGTWLGDPNSATDTSSTEAMPGSRQGLYSSNTRCDPTLVAAMGSCRARSSRHCPAATRGTTGPRAGSGRSSARAAVMTARAAYHRQ